MADHTVTVSKDGSSWKATCSACSFSVSGMKSANKAKGHADVYHVDNGTQVKSFKVK
jgi:hypothetical protein